MWYAGLVLYSLSTISTSCVEKPVNFSALLYLGNTLLLYLYWTHNIFCEWNTFTIFYRCLCSLGYHIQMMPVTSVWTIFMNKCDFFCELAFNFIWSSLDFQTNTTLIRSVLIQMKTSLGHLKIQVIDQLTSMWKQQS